MLGSNILRTHLHQHRDSAHIIPQPEAQGGHDIEDTVTLIISQHAALESQLQAEGNLWKAKRHTQKLQLARQR